MPNKPRTKARNNWIDVLRGLAILGILSVHTIQITDVFSYGDKSVAFTYVMGLGKYGVEVFFFISGWLLVSIYDIKGRNLGKAYFARRLGRIYPLWLIFFCINLIILKINGALFFGGQDLIDTHGITLITLLTLTFTLFISSALWNGVIPGGWSIQAEVAHYLSFPLIRKTSLDLVLKISIGINAFTASVEFFKPKFEQYSLTLSSILDAWIRLSFYSTSGYFLIGILSWIIFSKITNGERNNLSFSELGISHNTFIFFCASMLIIPCPFGKQIEAIGYLSFMLLISIGILKNKMLSNFFRILGKYSYFIYFAHFIALNSINWVFKSNEFLFIKILPQQLLYLLILLYIMIFSLLFAIPSMKYIEKPIIKIASRVK